MVMKNKSSSFFSAKMPSPMTLQETKQTDTGRRKQIYPRSATLANSVEAETESHNRQWLEHSRMLRMWFETCCRRHNHPGLEIGTRHLVELEKER